MFFIGRGTALSTGILRRILGKDKVRRTEKGDLGPGGICDNGILWWIKIRRGTADIIKRYFVFLGRNLLMQDTIHINHVEGEIQGRDRR